MHLENGPTSRRVNLIIDDLQEHAALASAIRPNFLLRGMRLALKLGGSYSAEATYPQSVSVTNKQLDFLAHALHKRIVSDPVTHRLEQGMLREINIFTENIVPPPAP